MLGVGATMNRVALKVYRLYLLQVFLFCFFIKGGGGCGRIWNVGTAAFIRELVPRVIGVRFIGVNNTRNWEETAAVPLLLPKNGHLPLMFFTSCR